MDDKKTNLGAHMNSYTPNKAPITQTPSSEEAEKMRKEFDELKKKLVKKFPFALSLSILPAHSFKFFEEDEGLLAEEIAKKPMHLMFLVPEDEYKNIAKKIKPEVVKLVAESKQNIWVHIKTPVDVWNYGLDSKFEMIDAIGSSYPLYDKGFLGTLRVANIHKVLVLRKFEKYVASYVIGGSLARGTAGKDSDVDTFVVIDDTDVKKMPRLQLLERLRGYIYDFIKEANALAGVDNLLNVQVYLLTDFWQSVKDATPVIFTFIRDGIPMYDRGTFLPWKLLLKMGKIKPSPEAVDTFMKYGDQNEGLVKRRLMDAMIDIYWGVVTPTQALMMLAGHAPPVPKTIVQEVKELFVDKEKIMGMKELKTLEKTVKLYKDYEHGKLKTISGAEIDVLLKESGDYDKKLKELRKKLEDRIVVQTVKQLYDEIFSLLKNVLGNHDEKTLVKKLDHELVQKGKIKKRMIDVLKQVIDAQDKAKSKKLTQDAADLIRRDASELVNALLEYSQRKELATTEKGVMQVKYGDRKAELVIAGSNVFLIEGGLIRKFTSHSLVSSSAQELEKALVDMKDQKQVSLPSHVLSVLKKELGEFELGI